HGWYDALLATVSAAAPYTATAARAASQVLAGLPETGVAHDGSEVCAVLQRLAAGRLTAGC
ncbi:MAG TPA: carbamoyl-phosphate-synthetase, partial [Geodermatophilus sp.]|nr:carbamoyl-phosphate-synthetase [Geodermatophilus sp.]